MPAPSYRNLAEHREAAGFTQESFAERLGVDRSTVGRWERGVQAPQPWQRPDIANALSLSLEELDSALQRIGTPSGAHALTRSHDASPSVVLRDSSQFTRAMNREQVGLPEPLREEDLVHATIPRLRRALDNYDSPADRPTRSLDQLGQAVARVIEHRLEARYLEMAYEIPDLVSELGRAVHLSSGVQRRRSAALLTLAYRAADGMAYKFGYLDLSARIIDFMRSTALQAEDPLLLAAVAYVRTETFFASGDLDTAASALVTAADAVAELGADAAPTLAAYGALHMRAAVVAGRAVNPAMAWDHLAEAERAARRVPDGVYHGTAFGPSSVRIHDLAVAVELRDSPTLVERAASWRPPLRLPAERRSHYYIDLAQAQLDLGFHDDACLSLEQAKEIAPQHTREHPRVRKALSQLLRSHPSPDQGMLTLAAWARTR